MNGKIFQVKISILDSPQKILKILSLMKFLGAPFCHNYSRSETILALLRTQNSMARKLLKRRIFADFHHQPNVASFFVLIPLIKYLRAPGQPSEQSPQRPSITVPLACTCVAHQTAPSAAWVEVHLSYFTPSYMKGNTHGSESAPKVPQEAVNYKNTTFSF